MAQIFPRVSAPTDADRLKLTLDLEALTTLNRKRCPVTLLIAEAAALAVE